MGVDIACADPILRDLWPKLRDAYSIKFPGCNLVLTFVDRSKPEQLKLFCKGRLDKSEIITYCDGYNKPSKHNAMPVSEAIDVGVLDKGVPVWDEKYFKSLGELIYSLGFNDKVDWGGHWKWKDWGHIQVR